MATIQFEMGESTINAWKENTEAQNKLIEALGNKTDSDDNNTRSSNNSRLGLSKLLDKLSIPLPGGVRLFGVGSFIESIANAKGPLDKLSTGFGQLIIGTIAVTEGFLALGKQLGGLTGGQAMEMSLAALGSTIKGITEGEWIGPQRIIGAQGAFAQEFGGLLTTQSATQIARMSQDLGVSVSDLAGLHRALQGVGVNAEVAVNAFREVGVGGKVATDEMAKNADAIARAGGVMNEFILDGIANAKKLGVEFSKMEDTLTGFSMDFAGTVESFSQLRAVIPGFQVDFAELMHTSLTGTTEDFIGIITGGLRRAGITSSEGMPRHVAELLKNATGFSSAEIDRLLDGQGLEMAMHDQLDTDRNSLLKTQIKLLSAGFGAIVGTVIATSGFKGVLGMGGALLGGAIGGGLFYGITSSVLGEGPPGNDVIWRSGGSPQLQSINPMDDIYAVNSLKSSGGGGGNETTKLLRQIAADLRSPKRMKIDGPSFDKVVVESVNRNDRGMMMAGSTA